jgi:rhodanese-related sulfurtransferase
MKTLILAVVLTAAANPAAPQKKDERPELNNPAIDPKAFLEATKAALALRDTRRVSEDEFIRMGREAGTIVLDARSAARYEELHVKGAINLSFPDITVDGLQRVLPDKTARILIYCNNNFLNTSAFLSKKASAALNLSTFTSLYDYGYRNVYELGPLVDIKKSKLTFEGAGIAQTRSLSTLSNH